MVATGILHAEIERMRAIHEHTELDAWAVADELRQRIRLILKRPGFASNLELRRQLEEAAEGPCAHIAEGFGRFLPGDNAKFVRIAVGSLNEVREHLNRARAKNLISEQEAAELDALTRRAVAVAKGYLRYLNSQLPRKRQPFGRRRQQGG